MSDRVCCYCQHFDAMHRHCSQLTLRSPYGKVFLERSSNSPACRTKYKPLSKHEKSSATTDESVSA